MTQSFILHYLPKKADVSSLLLDNKKTFRNKDILGMSVVLLCVHNIQYSTVQVLIIKSQQFRKSNTQINFVERNILCMRTSSGLRNKLQKAILHHTTTYVALQASCIVEHNSFYKWKNIHRFNMSRVCKNMCAKNYI